MKNSIASVEEKENARSLFDEYFGSDNWMPFSFTYDGIHYNGFNKHFKVTRKKNCIEAEHMHGLVVTVEFVQNFSYSSFSWKIHFNNESADNSAILEDICCSDVVFKGENPILHYTIGDDSKYPSAFTPQAAPLFNGMKLYFEESSGRPTSFVFPYYRFCHGDNCTIMALGWHGSWRSCFEHKDYITHYYAGLRGFRAYLKPGESVHSPETVIISCIGRCQNHAINMWRRWFIDCRIRRIEGKLPQPLKVVGGHGCMAPSELNELNQYARIDIYRKHGITNHLYWQDAGWYFHKPGITLPEELGKKCWKLTGTWLVDTNRLPHGLKGIADRVHADGGIVNLWFECERCTPGTEYYEKSGFCLDSSNTPGERRLVNMGLKEVRDFVLSRIDQILAENDIDIYRQDFNINPVPFWNYGDELEGKNRAGITENHYVTGMYEFYDTFCHRHPDMPIDMCASGGRRNDVEVMGYTSYLCTLTDSPQFNSEWMQCKRLGISEWFPHFCGGAPGNTWYNIASNMSFSFAPPNPCLENSLFKAAEIVWEQINYLFFGNYYPLTPCSLNNNVWIAWEYYDPEYHEGFLQCFRRSENDEDNQILRLQGLDINKVYRMTELIYGGEYTAIGKKLCEEGFEVTIPEKEGCRIWKIIRN